MSPGVALPDKSWDLIFFFSSQDYFLLWFMVVTKLNKTPLALLLLFPTDALIGLACLVKKIN